MFEEALKEKFRKVFEVQRVRFDDPGPEKESREQETLFVEISECKSKIRDTRQFCRVTGKCIMIAQNDKLPFGYFPKMIATHADDTKDLFFHDFEENTRVYGNLVERGFSFVFFFNSQYDPAVGNLNAIDIEVST